MAYQQIDLTDNRGVPLKVGAIFQLPVWDSDEAHTWYFIYCVKSNEEFIYLGGGIDFGSAIGKIVSRKELNEEIENSDPADGGIETLRVGY